METFQQRVHFTEASALEGEHSEEQIMIGSLQIESLLSKVPARLSAFLVHHSMRPIEDYLVVDFNTFLMHTAGQIR